MHVDFFTFCLIIFSREDILKSTIGNGSLNTISNDNGVRVVNFATSKNLTVKKYDVPTL
jgi:hypothetical protein